MLNYIKMSEDQYKVLKRLASDTGTTKEGLIQFFFDVAITFIYNERQGALQKMEIDFEKHLRENDWILRLSQKVEHYIDLDKT